MADDKLLSPRWRSMRLQFPTRHCLLSTGTALVSSAQYLLSKNRPRESDFFVELFQRSSLNYLVNPLFLIAEDSTWSTEIDSFVITQDCGFFSQDN